MQRQTNRAVRLETDTTAPLDRFVRVYRNTSLADRRQKWNDSRSRSLTTSPVSAKVTHVAAQANGSLKIPHRSCAYVKAEAIVDEDTLEDSATVNLRADQPHPSGEIRPEPRAVWPPIGTPTMTLPIRSRTYCCRSRSWS